MRVYDANGNTLSDAQGRSFTWDFENRLTQGGWPCLSIADTKYKKWVPRSCDFCRGGYHGRWQ